MMLLIDFLCRFGWGLALALTLTPAGLVPAGFFRANLLVVLGLATLAALLEWTAGPGAAWLVPAAAAVAAWLGSIAWLAERKGAGLVLCGTCALLFAVATAQLHPFQAQVWPAAVAAIRALLSGLLVGLVVHAMLLGHWYLNAPGMRVSVLQRMIDWALLAWGVQLCLVLSSTALAVTTAGQTLDPATLALLTLRWLAGLIGLPILLVMSRKTLAIPNTQSATGILYVACLAAIVGELTAQLLQAAAAMAGQN